MQQFSRTRQRRFGDGAEHCRKFLHAFFRPQLSDFYAGSPCVDPFCNGQVPIGPRSYLWQVAHADDLMVFGQTRELFAHDGSGTAAQPGLDFVENQDRHRVGIPEHRLERQH